MMACLEYWIGPSLFCNNSNKKHNTKQTNKQKTIKTFFLKLWIPTDNFLDPRLMGRIKLLFLFQSFWFSALEYMASASTIEEPATCPICSSPYQEARKLPGCTHSFCETCILTYVLNLQKDAKLENSFQCPVCRLPSHVPDNGDITLEWIQSMDKIKDRSSKLSSEFYKSCSQCSRQEKYRNAKHYCVDCRESFCEHCSKTLHSFMFTSNHALIEIDSDIELKNVHEQALMMIGKFLTCFKHSRQSVAFYCESEKQFICSECAIFYHQNCTKMKIEELADKQEDTISQTLVSSFKKLLDHTQSEIQMLQEHGQENKSEPDILLDEFFALRRNVNHQFDILEESLRAESKALCKEISIKNLDEIDELKDVGQRISVLTYLLENLADKIPAAFSYVCILEAGNTLNLMKEETAKRGLSRQKTNIMLKTENVLKTLLDLGPNEINKIASVQMVNESIPLTEYDKEYCLRNYTVKKIKTDTVIADYCRDLMPCYYGVLFLPDNKMVLSDIFFGSVCLTDKTSKLLSYYRLGENEPTPKSNSNLNMLCATTMANNNIAVSVRDKKGIYFLSAANETLEYKGGIRCKNTPLAIHGLRNNDIAVLWSSPLAFGIITLTGGSYHEKVYFNKDKNQKKLRSNGFMSVDEERGHVILPSKTDITIYCYDFEANQVFAYHDIMVTAPTGVAIDGDGNIYVCDEMQRALIILSPVGILIRIIRDECPTRPLGIGFKDNGKTFVVTDYKQQSAVHFLSLVHS